MKRVTRREFFSGAAVVLGTTLLSACGATPTATPVPPTKAPAAPAATTAPAAAAAPTATKAPAAPTTAPAAPTVAPTKAPAAPTAAPKLGDSLISKNVGGVTLITDPTKFPKTFKEAPMLADLVKAGKLPPVEQRVSQDPLVLKPVNEVGKYGGIWRRGFTGPGDTINGSRAAGSENPLYLDASLKTIVPNILKSYEMGEGGKTITLNLRKGMKWSNGDPFTADDWMFWFNDLYGNKQLVPNAEPRLSINGKPGTLAKIDDSTIRWTFAEPYPLFPRFLALITPVAGWTQQGKNGMGSYAPSKYLKQFHPSYVSKEELDATVKAAKHDNWVTLMKFKNDWALNPELPTITAWKTVTPANTPVWTLERNPYSVWVDTDGNQLPYIDKIVLTLAETIEVLNLRAIAGEYDMQARHIDIAKIPVYLDNEAKGGYKLRVNPGEWGADFGFWINMNYDADPEVNKWFNVTDFRRALSLGIDRAQINETFFLGIGVPGSAAPAETNIFFPGKEYRTMWSTYDLKKAGEMLDKIGLDKKDADGYRLRSDGKGRLSLFMNCAAAAQIKFAPIAEMIGQQWKKLGIEFKVNELERSLAEKKNGNNENEMWPWINDSSDDPLSDPVYLFPNTATANSMPLFGKWFVTSGKDGKVPPERMQQSMSNWQKAFGSTEPDQIKLVQQMWTNLIDECWYIGVVGQSGAAEGIQITKVDMGNVPERFLSINRTYPPAIARPMQFYWKKPQA